MVKTVRLCFISFLIIFSNTDVYGNYHWWNVKHNWDGITHWSRYLTISPAYMGPNALPVPHIYPGVLPQDIQLKTGFAYYQGKGDFTGNIYNRLFLPLYSERVSLKISMVTLEYFESDSVIRDLRKARYPEDKGFAVGDVYLTTLIQLLKGHERWPDMLLTINLKTASGSNLSSARFTDTPGYFFDLSVGRTILTGNQHFPSFRYFLSSGFYVWQTHTVNYQNDAYLYGAGFELGLKKDIVLNQTLAGYIGYMNNGDRPMVSRMSLHWSPGRSYQIRLLFEHGINDFPFNSLQFGITRIFSADYYRN